MLAVAGGSMARALRSPLRRREMTTTPPVRCEAAVGRCQCLSGGREAQGRQRRRPCAHRPIPSAWLAPNRAHSAGAGMTVRLQARPPHAAAAGVVAGAAVVMPAVVRCRASRRDYRRHRAGAAVLPAVPPPPPAPAALRAVVAPLAVARALVAAAYELMRVAAARPIRMRPQ